MEKAATSMSTNAVSMELSPTHQTTLPTSPFSPNPSNPFCCAAAHQYNYSTAWLSVMTGLFPAGRSHDVPSYHDAPPSLHSTYTNNYCHFTGPPTPSSPSPPAPDFCPPPVLSITNRLYCRSSPFCGCGTAFSSWPASTGLSPGASS